MTVAVTRISGETERVAIRTDVKGVWDYLVAITGYGWQCPTFRQMLKDKGL
jgi:hypothetical protein